MTRSAVELDFFSMEKESTHHAKLESGIAFGDIQSVIPKTDPDVLNPQLPVFSPISRLCCSTKNGTENAPMTIFYDATVAFFDVSGDEVFCQSNASLALFPFTFELAFSHRNQIFFTLVGISEVGVED
ncbi:uncharacterized protein LOC132628379 [Lycium barbarum]|uniref:uncharacterized protein LOC132628379 n=1 Tax=Lycium barbarum TaxID=112863 RepID=UPI00293EF5FA|nr:uncharacterized protein LOC132628379 [Lycium barbarum]